MQISGQYHIVDDMLDTSLCNGDSVLGLGCLLVDWDRFHDRQNGAVHAQNIFGVFVICDILITPAYPIV